MERLIPSPLSSSERLLLSSIYGVLQTNHKWPTYAYLDRLLYTSYDVDIDAIAASLPPRLSSLHPGRRHYLDSEEVKLTIAGLRFVNTPTAQADANLFFRVFRQIVAEDKSTSYTLESQPRTCLYTDELSEKWSVHPIDLRRVFQTVAAEPEPWMADFSGTGPDNANLRICASKVLRKFRDAKTLDVYLSIRHDFFNPPRPAPGPAPGQSFPPGPSPSADKRDVFVAHATPDKRECAGPLAAALTVAGLTVWYDEYELTLGDRLRRNIDEGLANSRYGVVILSPAFFARNWPQTELDGLAQKEVDGRKVILPVLYQMTMDQVREISPTLADRVAAPWDRGIDYVVGEITRAIAVDRGRGRA